MDLLEELKRREATLVTHGTYPGVRAVLRHIQIAEQFLVRGRTEREDELFNDVIYRSNQAYEGMLKEAYSVLEGKSASKLSTSDIEQYFETSGRLAKRVSELLTNYRRRWRNPSTHDHQLIFNEQEALLAIEAVSYQKEKDLLISRGEPDTSRATTYRSASAQDKITFLLKEFSVDIASTVPDMLALTEAELLGHLRAYLAGIDPALSFEREPELPTEPSLRPDGIVTLANERFVIELKRGSGQGSLRSAAEHQMLRYLSAAQITHGFLYIPPLGREDIVRAWTTKYIVADKQYFVHLIAPGLWAGNPD